MFHTYKQSVFAVKTLCFCRKNTLFLPQKHFVCKSKTNYKQPDLQHVKALNGHQNGRKQAKGVGLICNISYTYTTYYA